MSTEMQTKMQASPEQNFTPVQTGLLQKKSALCNTPGLVKDSGRDKEKLTLQRSLVDQAGTTTVPRFGHDFSRLSVHSNGAGMIQTKLKINEPGDIYEQEADRVADAVMQMPEPGVQREVEPEEEEKTLQTKPLASEIMPLIQRQIEPEEEEEEEEIQPKRIAGTAHKITPEIERDIQSVRGAGRPLSASERTFFEPRFGADFESVRVHSDARAAYAARSVDARAFTVGVDVVFGGGEYSTGTSSGRRLLAHELAHVVQQNGGRNVRLKKATPVPMSPTIEEPYIQREEAGAPPASPAPPALPTMSLNPGAQLTRGQDLTATKSFTPTAGETLNITAWRYITPAHGTVTRPSTDTDFQTQWSGTMALSGLLEVGYRITPAGGSPEPEAVIQHDITVQDRTGSPWSSQVTQELEQTYGGQPSPPTQFGNMGYHESLANPLPNPTSNQISSGLNTQFSYVSSLTPGTYISRPSIHPDLIDTGSVFYLFHQNPSRLYLVVGTTRTLIPLSAYSNLSVSSGTATFDVPDWEAFYKQYNVFEVTATISSRTTGQTITLQDSWWGLDGNAPDANVEVQDDAAIQQAFQPPLRLYLVDGTTRTLIPSSAYSNLSVSGGMVTFVVPDWEFFYKQHDFYEITATAGDQTVPLQDSWWGLDDNLPGADVEIRNDAAIRRALGISRTAGYGLNVQQRRAMFAIRPTPLNWSAWRIWKV